MKLTNYGGKYIGLKLSCGSTGFGKLEIKMKKETFSVLGKQTEVRIPDQYFLNEAWLPSKGSVEGMLRDYLDFKKRGIVKKTDIFEIEPNHVTAIQDISEKVEKV